MFDLPEAPRPDPGTPAPPRFLPEFDNLIVAHANRRRIMTDEDRKRVCVGSLVSPTFLLDGVVAGTWKLQRDDRATAVVLTPYRPVAAADRAGLAAEGGRLLEFAAPGRAREVRFQPEQPPGQGPPVRAAAAR